MTIATVPTPHANRIIARPPQLRMTQRAEEPYTGTGADAPGTEAPPATPTIRGYAAIFYDGSRNSEYVLWEGYRERILPGAFDRAIAEKHDVRCLKNHDPNLLLGRTKSNTLSLSIDSVGLAYDCAPGNTQAGRDVIAEIERGDMTGSSFSFSPRETRWVEEVDGEGKTTIIREILDVDLYDVGPVTFPAYEATTAATDGNEPRAARGHEEAFRAWTNYQNERGLARLRGHLTAINERADQVDPR